MSERLLIRPARGRGASACCGAPVAAVRRTARYCLGAGLRRGPSGQPPGRRPAGASAPTGFTILELLIAMTIFTFLGIVVVYLMTTGMSTLAAGTRDTSIQDRIDVVIPQVRASLAGVYAGHSFDPPPPPKDDTMGGGTRAGPVAPPPVDVRMRSGFLKLTDAPEGPSQALTYAWFAFVAAEGEEWRDPLLRRDTPAGVEAKEWVPATVDAATAQTSFQPPGGLKEVCWIAMPDDPAVPAILSLYTGFRAPIGGEGSLLEPKNLDSRKEIQERCRRMAHGLLHFSVTWRRVFAATWEPTLGAAPGDGVRYVGPLWDSTRALDPQFPLTRGPESLLDPSDDVFPRAVRIEVTLATPGYPRGDTELAESIDSEALRIRVRDEAYVKIDGEWMRYRPSMVDIAGAVTVERAQRGSIATDHSAGSPAYVGQPSRQDVWLAVWRDRYVPPPEHGRVR